MADIRTELINGLMSDYDTNRGQTTKAVDLYLESHGPHIQEAIAESDNETFSKVVEHIHDTLKYWK